MILSFHPCYEADVNLLCAGRDPDETDLAAIRDADAVVLPQGCREALYRMARQNCPHVFPNYDARFKYPGKTGQIRLFQQMEAACPRTWIFADTDHFRRQRPMVREMDFPLVLKLDWGGEGDTVFLLRSKEDQQRAIAISSDYERTGQRGFVVQNFVPHGNRSLRVAVIGQTRVAYWRIQDKALVFGTSVSKGARIDSDSDPHLRHKAMSLVRDFCRQTRVNLAGFDLIFKEIGGKNKDPQPLFLEINYFFGRTGLGGSERFYSLLQAAVDSWLVDLGLAVHPPSTKTCIGKKP